MKLIATWIWTIITYLTTRCSMRTKYEPSYVAQSEVTLLTLLTFTSPGSPSSKLASGHQHHDYRAARLEPRDSIISLKVHSCARESVTHVYTHCIPVQVVRMTLIRLHRYTRRHERVQIGLSSQLGFLFLTLLVSISPNSCSCGA